MPYRKIKEFYKGKQDRSASGNLTKIDFRQISRAEVAILFTALPAGDKNFRLNHPDYLSRDLHGGFIQRAFITA